MMPLRDTRSSATPCSSNDHSKMGLLSNHKPQVWQDLFLLKLTHPGQGEQARALL